MSNRKAKLLMRERRVLKGGFIEVVVWSCRGHSAGRSTASSTGSPTLSLRYDNEAGKGDHRHVGVNEAPYAFVSDDQLLDDFLADVAAGKGN